MFLKDRVTYVHKYNKEVKDHTAFVNQMKMLRCVSPNENCMYKARVMWYVYGIEYPTNWKNSFIFIDNWIINIEESKLPTTLLRMKQLL